MKETPTLDALLAHQDFVAGLARRLLFDEHAAADLAQDTWTAAISSPPGSEKPLRRWLAVVARRLAWKRLRGEERRRRRERGTARSEPVASPAEILEKENIRRDLLEMVLSLPEPYRSAILLRYYEDLPVRELAARLEIPAETARTRVKRGIARLRHELEQKFGASGCDWRVALMPFAVPEASAAGGSASLAPVSGSEIPGALWPKLVVGAVVVGLGVPLLLWTSSPPEPPTVASERTDAVSSPTTSPTIPSTREDARLRRNMAGPAPPEEEASGSEPAAGEFVPPPAPADRPPRFEGSEASRLVVLVKDPSGNAVAGCEVQLRSAPRTEDDAPRVSEETLTDDEGLAVFRLRSGPYHVFADEDGWYAEKAEVYVAAGEETTRFELVVERMASVAGRVEDPQGHPVPGAEVWVRKTRTDEEGIPHTWTSERRTSDDRGEFLLDEVVFHRGAEYTVRARHPGYLDVPDEPVVVRRSELTAGLVLRFEDPGAGVTGVVVSADGRPAPGATLVLFRKKDPGFEEIRKGSCDAEGTFEWWGLREGEHVLRASLESTGSASEPFEVREAGERIDLGSILLSRSRLFLRGRVVRADGEAASFARLSLRHHDFPRSEPLTTEADGEGYYEIEAPEPGPYAVEVVWDPRGEPLARVKHRETGVFAGGQDREIVLVPRGLLFELRHSAGLELRGWHGFVTAYAPSPTGLPSGEASSRRGFTDAGPLLRWTNGDFGGRYGEWRFDFAVDGFVTRSIYRRIDGPLEEEFRVVVRLEPE